VIGTVLRIVSVVMPHSMRQKVRHFQLFPSSRPRLVRQPVTSRCAEACDSGQIVETGLYIAGHDDPPGRSARQI
jgi:hypothetical protein